MQQSANENSEDLKAYSGTLKQTARHCPRCRGRRIGMKNTLSSVEPGFQPQLMLISGIACKQLNAHLVVYSFSYRVGLVDSQPAINESH